jgi:hypothetical protein
MLICKSVEQRYQPTSEIRELLENFGLMVNNRAGLGKSEGDQKALRKRQWARKGLSPQAEFLELLRTPEQIAYKA